MIFKINKTNTRFVSHKCHINPVSSTISRANTTMGCTGSQVQILSLRLLISMNKDPISNLLKKP